jgi:hypothetical protein
VEDARGGLDGLDDEDSGYESGLVTSPNVSSASAETEVVCPR